MLYPFANLVYPESYTVSLNNNQLQALARTRGSLHTSWYAEKLHQLSETIFLPGYIDMQLFAHVIEPLPGKNKKHALWGLAIRISSLVLGILILPFAIGSFIFAMPLRCIDFQSRPALSYINNSLLNDKAKKKEELLMTKERPLHIRTHNLGFVTSSIGCIGDLRPATERAKEVVTSIVGDPYKPDIICFQEAFHEAATKILCDGIKTEYPYIIHTIAPHISGFNCGSMIASKYPIESAYFQRLRHMLGPERAAPRGVTRIHVESMQGPILIYSVHTQALIGEDRAQARLKQLSEIEQLMKLDAQNEPKAVQILVGDFNTSRITAWGEDNLDTEGKGQSERPVYQYLQDNFRDLFLEDHDPETGVRTKGTPFYLQADNARLKEKNLIEPSGSWYHGPFANPGWILSSKMRRDREMYGRTDPKKVTAIAVKESTWGTPEWHSKQTANTARFDYVLLPKDEKSKLQGCVEIRRSIIPKKAQSAATDHLPVDARIWSVFSQQKFAVKT